MTKRRSFLITTAVSALGVFTVKDPFSVNPSHFSNKVFKSHFGNTAKLANIIESTDGKSIQATCIVKSPESFIEKIGNFSDKNSKITANGNSLRFQRSDKTIDMKLIIQQDI